MSSRDHDPIYTHDVYPRRKRDWKPAREKVAAEGRCRACAGGSIIDAAHIIPRSRVQAGPGEDPRNIVPLCRFCHGLFDSNRLDITGLLSHEEQAYAVSLVGIAEAMRRLTGDRMAA